MELNVNSPDFQLTTNSITMKFFFCVFFSMILVAVTALTQDQTQKLNKISTQCRVQSGVSEDVILNARNGVFVDDPKLKKQILCVAKNVAVVTESGDIDVDSLKRKLKRVSENDQEVDSVINKCVVKKDTSENTVFEIIKCVLKEKPTFSPVD